MIFAVWHGGSSYSPGGIEDTETFKSVAAARAAFQDRCYVGGHVLQDFTYVRRDEDSTYTPAVDAATTEMHLFHGMPDGDLYPDMIIKFGPRGGVRVERV